MSRYLLPAALLCLAGYGASQPKPEDHPAPANPPAPLVRPLPLPDKGPGPRPEPKRPRRPWGPFRGAPVGAHVGGPVHPDGTEIQCDLPPELHRENVASKGLGCCVFRSLDHAAAWQGVEALRGFPEWMIAKGIPGGGWPEKVDELIPRIARDRGLPVPEFLQVEGTDLSIARQALESGRMVCITYSHSPSGRYAGRRISHMVNAVHGDAQGRWCVLDNNYVEPRGAAYEWLTAEEMRGAATGSKKLWAIILLAPPPPPPPRN